jgi:hypothetical protein
MDQAARELDARAANRDALLPAVHKCSRVAVRMLAAVALLAVVWASRIVARSADVYYRGNCTFASVADVQARQSILRAGLRAELDLIRAEFAREIETLEYRQSQLRDHITRMVDFVDKEEERQQQQQQQQQQQLEVGSIFGAA